jgi:hypothetical protein
LNVLDIGGNASVGVADASNRRLRYLKRVNGNAAPASLGRVNALFG